MPLFGKSKHTKADQAAYDTTGTGGNRLHKNNPIDQTTDHQMGFGQPPITNSTAGGGFGNNNTTAGQGQFTSGPGMTGSGGNHNYAGGYNNDDPYTAGGVGQGQFGTGVGGQRNHMGGLGGGNDIPPSQNLHHANDRTTGGAGQRMTGKVEAAVGSMLGSSALKAKGLQKEQEANSVKLQERELAEAERLEREALMRRERAVGHGAHPANSNLGAGHLGQGVNPNSGFQ